MRLTIGSLAAAVVILRAETAPAPPVEEILRKVAESQATAQAAREKIVYTQFVHAKLLRMNGKPAREEKRTYTVTPSPDGFERKLEKFEGWYERKGQWIPYDTPGYEYKGIDLDANIMNDLIEDWTGNEGSRDGIDKDLFPLTAAHQEKYNFRATGPYTLAFEPRAKNSSPWKGEILVDKESLYPRTMNSTFAYEIPMAVKILFGISLRQVGYSVTYDRTIDGLWFPVSAGTEFSLRILFGYSRTMTLSMKNSDFRRGGG